MNGSNFRSCKLCMHKLDLRCKQLSECSFCHYLSVSVSDSPSSCSNNLYPPVGFSLGLSSSSTSSSWSSLFLKAWTGRRENTDSSPVMAKLLLDTKTAENSQQWTMRLFVWPLVKVNSNKAEQGTLRHTAPLRAHRQTHKDALLTPLEHRETLLSLCCYGNRCTWGTETGRSDRSTCWENSRTTAKLILSACY